jgi:hypothetical protein
MIAAIKKVIEVAGLVPTIVGFFTLTPQWFRPTRFLEPAIEYAAAFVSFAVFIATIAYLKKPEAWSPEATRRHLIEAFAGVAGAIIAGGAYTWFVRAFPQAGIGLDILQIALWASFFGCTSFFLTAFACVFKAP